MTDLCDPSKRNKLRTKVRGAMTHHIRDKIERYANKVGDLRKYFVKIGFEFNEKDFNFVDSNGDEQEMGSLTSRAYTRQFPEITEYIREDLGRIANDLIQTRLGIKNFEEITGGVENVVDRIKDACDRREKFRSRFGNLMGEIVGKHQSRIEPNAVYHISTDPYDIFTKSTARSWSPANCERVEGASREGIYSDIAHNSAVLFLLDKRLTGFDKAIARMNLRICVIDEEAVTPKKKYSIGLDVNWYRGKHSHDRYVSRSKKKFDNMNLTGEQAMNEVVGILQDRGFVTDYDSCVTPFTHEGFSDIEGANNVVIEYKTQYPRCKFCGVETKPRYHKKYDGMCLFCYLHPEKRPKFPDL